MIKSNRILSLREEAYEYTVDTTTYEAQADGYRIEGQDVAVTGVIDN